MDFKKIGIIVLLLGAFCAFDVSAKEKEEQKEEKIEAEPEKKKCEKSDSLINIQERAIVQDSVSEDQHHNNAPSSMSSMSYNILFQVIYRYSFKEIFDSPAASDIVTN
jgi:hypothetical protein